MAPDDFMTTLQADIDRLKQSRCPVTFKRGHDTKADANVERELVYASTSKYVQPLDVYSCEHCHKWHVGNPKRKSRRIKVRR